MDDYLKIQIREALSVCEVDSVVRKLTHDLGVSEVTDLQLIKYEDLIDVLKPIQIRRLLKVWETKDVPEPGMWSNSCSSNSDNVKQSNMLNWQEFEVPWNKMPVRLLNCLKNDQRPTPQMRRILVRTVAKAMYKLCRLPGRKAINVVSSRIVEKCPSLKDMLFGDIIGPGYYSLSKQIENRFGNLNRGLGCSNKTKLDADPDGVISFSKSTKENEDQNDIENPLKKKRTRYGCLNWKPVMPPNETKVLQNEKQLLLLNLQKAGPKTNNDTQIATLMRETFYTQRLDINRSLTTEHLLEKWPLLFSKLGFYEHFEMLLGFNIEVKFEAEMQIKSKKIVDCLLSVPISSDKKLNSIVKTVKEHHREDQDIKAAFILMLIQGYFGESGDIFKIVDDTTCSNDLGVNVLPSAPCLIACGKNLLECRKFMLSVDKRIVNDDIQDFQEGFLMMFASFYCLNISYPVSDGCTLEFIQRCFMGINPERGSKIDKGKGKRSTINPNVIRLINTISSHEWLEIT